MDAPIRNISDLQMEIDRLKGVERAQGAAISQRFSSPSAVFSTIYSLFSGTPGNDGERKSFFEQDFIGLASRFLLPFTLNKTLFRNSGFLVKALVGYVSQKASHFITEDTVVTVWDKVKHLFQKKETEAPAHKTVPDFSETA